MVIINDKYEVTYCDLVLLLTVTEFKEKISRLLMLRFEYSFLVVAC